MLEDSGLVELVWETETVDLDALEEEVADFDTDVEPVDLVVAPVEEIEDLDTVEGPVDPVVIPVEVAEDFDPVDTVVGLLVTTVEEADDLDRVGDAEDLETVAETVEESCLELVVVFERLTLDLIVAAEELLVEAVLGAEEDDLLLDTLEVDRVRVLNVVRMLVEILDDDGAELVEEELALTELDLVTVDGTNGVVVLTLEEVVGLAEVDDAFDEADAVLELAFPLEVEEIFVDVLGCVVDETTRVLVVTLVDEAAEDLDEGWDAVDVVLIVEATVVDEGLDPVKVDEMDGFVVEAAVLLVFTEEDAVDLDVAEGEFVEETTDERVDFDVVLALPLELTPFEVVADLVL